MKMYDAQKANGLFIKLKYQKFQASISKWEVLIQKKIKWYDVYGAKWKASKLCYLIEQKKIFDFYNCFWKVFLFWKFSKISKNLCNLVLVTCLVGQASCMLQSRAYTEGFRDSFAGQSPSHEKT